MTSTSNYFQFFILIGYFFVGIFLCILLTYLFKLQLLIFNYRLLTFKNQNLRSTYRERPFTIQNDQNFQTFRSTENRQLNNVTINELPISKLPKSSNIMAKDNKYGNIYKTIDRSYNFSLNISNNSTNHLTNNLISNQLYSKSSDLTNFQIFNPQKSRFYKDQ